MFAEYIEWRANHPSDDLITELLNAEVEEPDGRRRPLERTEVLAYAAMIVDQIVTTPGSDHRLPRLAERAALSERQLSRVFLRETHTTPGRFAERVRVEAARGLLENSGTSLDAIAARCGFGSTETMRRAFKRVISIGPDSKIARGAGYDVTAAAIAAAERSMSASVVAQFEIDTRTTYSPFQVVPPSQHVPSR
jgi:AraC-like DNA-binding protein